MLVLSVIFLAIAVSFDAFAIGITYGMNRITISLWPKAVLSIVSGLFIFLSMLFGQLLGRLLSPKLNAIMGGLIFILLGLYNIWRNYRATERETMLLNLRIPVLGLIIQAFFEPLAADSDQSKDISASEAIVLGGVLALDALAAGIAAALLRLPPYPTALSVMAASFVFISQGLKAGQKLSVAADSRHKLRWMPGLIIALLGIAKFFL